MAGSSKMVISRQTTQPTSEITMDNHYLDHQSEVDQLRVSNGPHAHRAWCQCPTFHITQLLGISSPMAQGDVQNPKVNLEVSNPWGYPQSSISRWDFPVHKNHPAMGGTPMTIVAIINYISTIS